jgi:hypothetical protein
MRGVIEMMIWARAAGMGAGDSVMVVIRFAKVGAARIAFFAKVRRFMKTQFTLHPKKILKPGNGRNGRMLCKSRQNDPDHRCPKPCKPPA